MDLKLNPEEAPEDQMAIIYNMVILTKLTNEQTVAQIRLALPRQVSKEFQKSTKDFLVESQGMLNATFLKYRSEAITALSRNMPMKKPFEEFQKLEIQPSESYTIYAAKLKDSFEIFRLNMANDDVEALTKERFISALSHKFRGILRLNETKNLNELARDAQKLKDEEPREAETISVFLKQNDVSELKNLLKQLIFLELENKRKEVREKP